MNNYDYEYMNYQNNFPLDEECSSNSFGSDRVNYIQKDNMDNYKIQFLNQSTKKDGMDYLTNLMGFTSSNSDAIAEPYKGFIRGNMFENLYEQYKNYKPMNLNSSNERENLLNQLQQYTFALIDLDLYLDVNPNDGNAIKLYNNFLGIKRQIMDKYENMYGPLTLDSDDLNKNSWVWIRSPWPWEER